MKVKANSFYKYNPIGLDRIDPRTNLKPNDLVQVKKIPGCPPPNTMGHCHVYYKGKFAGLVLTNSLVKASAFIYTGDDKLVSIKEK